MPKLTLTQQLADAKIEINRLYCKLKNKNKAVNPIRDDFSNLILDLDIQQACNRYRWGGLPNGLMGWLIEHMLYMRGSLAGYFYGGILYILPYAQTGGINTYSIPNAIRSIPYNGMSNDDGSMSERELMVNVDGKPNDDASAVLLYDRIPLYNQGAIPIPRFITIHGLIKLQADIISRIKINLDNSTVKQVIWVENEKQKDAFSEAMDECLEAGKSYVIAVKGQNNFTSPDTFSGNADLETQALFEAWESLNSIRCATLGLSNQGAFEKKERIVTSELDGTNEQADITYDIGLYMRKLWLEQMKQVYPQYIDILNKITITLNENNEQKAKETNDNDKDTIEQSNDIL